MKIYTGTRNQITDQVTVTVTYGTREYHLFARHDLFNTAPIGFEWGRVTAGANVLSTAILCDCMSEQVAIHNYQHFARDMVSGMPRAGWSLTSDQIQQWYFERGHSTVEESDAQDCEGV